MDAESAWGGSGIEAAGAVGEGAEGENGGMMQVTHCDENTPIAAEDADLHHTCAHAFNMGCDARIAGVPFKDNPYSKYKGGAYWEMGWRDVDENWGRKAKWPVKKLPEVRT